MKAQRYWNEAEWSKGDLYYTFPNGAVVKFFSVDSSKAHGPRRDVLFLNERNSVTYEVYTQLETRTRKLNILDYNPTSEFWVHTEVMPHNPHNFLKLTYRDNEALESAIVRSIQSRMHDANYCRAYGLKEIGLLEGVIYENWEQVEAVPEDAQLLRHIYPSTPFR